MRSPAITCGVLTIRRHSAPDESRSTCRRRCSSSPKGSLPTSHATEPLMGFPPFPVLILKTGHYALHHGGLGIIRTLGMLDVPVFTVIEDRFAPAGLSKYL